MSAVEFSPKMNTTKIVKGGCRGEPGAVFCSMTSRSNLNAKNKFHITFYLKFFPTSFNENFPLILRKKSSKN